MMTNEPTKKLIRKELLKKKKLKEEHHIQMYKMCFDRLKKHYDDNFYKDDAIVEILNLCLSQMKYKHIVKFYDVLEEKGINKY